MLAESTGSLVQRKWVSEAVASVGLPMWTGFKVHSTEDDPTIRIGYAGEEPFEQALEEVLPMGGSLMTVFHSGVDDTDAAIPILKKYWDGPMAAYPESGRRDYVARFSDGTPNEMDPEGYLGMANKWVNEGRPGNRRMLRNGPRLHQAPQGRPAGQARGAPRSLVTSLSAEAHGAAQHQA